MSATDDYTSGYGQSITGWVGWIVFAAVFMITIGAVNAIQGLAALFRDETYFIAANGGELLTFNWTAWGWIHLIFGILLAIVGIWLMTGNLVARVLGVVLVTLNLVSQFAFIAAYPWWSLIVIALDIVILYALIVHGDELAKA